MGCGSWGRTAVLAGSLAVGLRLPFVHDLPYTDEGGLLVVAGHWHAGGPFLYGPLFVDRPPLLLAFFRLADDLGGVVSLRLLGLGLVAVAVACATRAGTLLGGTRGAVAASLTCAALLADPLLGTREVDAETVGVPLVLLAAVLALEGLRRDRTGFLWFAGSGAAGSAALLVKQNLADGVVFTVALVLAGGLADHTGSRRTAGALGCVVLGAAIPGAAAIAWSTTATGAEGLFYSLYGFRIASSNTLFAQPSATQMGRLHELFRSALLSGLVLLLVVALVPLLRRDRRDARAVASIAMLGTAIGGVVGGGYYWTHYLIGLVPATCLLVGRLAGAVSRPLLLGVAVAASLAATGVEVAGAATDVAPNAASEVGSLSAWLDAARCPGDSAAVLYGEAAVFETTRLRPAYPFLWTLPQRILDPRLHRLVHTLDRTRGPTFVVVRSRLDQWRQDPHGRLQRILDRRYRLVADVHGDSVYLRRGEPRSTSGCTRGAARWRASSAGLQRRGTRRSNRPPGPGLATSSAPTARAIRRASGSPSPDPSWRVECPGSKTASSWSSGTPWPSSTTLSTTYRGSRVTSSRTSPAP